jgi:hypothetical protein
MKEGDIMSDFRWLGLAGLLVLAGASPLQADDHDKHGKHHKKDGKRDAAPAEAGAACQAAGKLGVLTGLAEASGLALGRRTRGVLWAHNDSGPPVIFALDASGNVKGRVQVTGAAVVDWEDVEVGPCGSGACLYVADIGDNQARRPQITVYRVPEPLPGDAATAPAEAFHARYPDRPQDAEALLVAPGGALFVATKGETAPPALYRFPLPLKAGATVTLERVAALGDGKGTRARITDGAVSPDGRWAALRTHQAVVFYRAADLASGRLQEVLRADLTPLREPQGEGLALDDGGTVYVCGEAPRRGTFARVTCTLPARSAAASPPSR